MPRAHRAHQVSYHLHLPGALFPGPPDPLEGLLATPAAQLRPPISFRHQGLLPPPIELELLLPESHFLFCPSLHIHFGKDRLRNGARYAQAGYPFGLGIKPQPWEGQRAKHVLQRDFWHP